MQVPLPQPEILWDSRKVRSNLRKHKISVDEAATVFNDILSTTKPDPDHSLGENRFITVGLSSSYRLLLVAHIEDPVEIRIISARLTTRSERDAYEND